jgi:hypothetical protein
MRERNEIKKERARQAKPGASSSASSSGATSSFVAPVISSVKQEKKKENKKSSQSNGASSDSSSSSSSSSDSDSSTSDEDSESPSTSSHHGNVTPKLQQAFKVTATNGVSPTSPFSSSSGASYNSKQLPITVKGCTIVNLGEIEPFGKGFHNKNYIYPIGFERFALLSFHFLDLFFSLLNSPSPFYTCSTRRMASLADETKMTVYHSKIEDAGNGNPRFIVWGEDTPEQVFTNATSSGVWSEALKRIKRRSSASVSGPEMFGLFDPIVQMMIQVCTSRLSFFPFLLLLRRLTFPRQQDLPRANECKSYQWKSFSSDGRRIDEVKEPVERKKKSSSSTSSYLISPKPPSKKPSSNGTGREHFGNSLGLSPELSASLLSLTGGSSSTLPPSSLGATSFPSTQLGKSAPASRSVNDSDSEDSDGDRTGHSSDSDSSSSSSSDSSSSPSPSSSSESSSSSSSSSDSSSSSSDSDSSTD